MKKSLSYFLNRIDTDVNTDSFEVKNKKIFVLSIKGTNSSIDIINNLRLKKKKILWKDIKFRINRIDYLEALGAIKRYKEQLLDCDELWLEGHSRGGAIALVIGFILLTRYDFKKKIKYFVATAAKPSGNKLFCLFMSPFVTAYRHKGDIIPFLPPWNSNVYHLPFGKWQPFWKAHQIRNYRSKRINKI